MKYLSMDNQPGGKSVRLNRFAMPSVNAYLDCPYIKVTLIFNLQTFV